MSIAKAIATEWAALSKVASVAKATIAKIASVVAVTIAEKVWTTKTTTFSCDQIMQLDASTLLIASGGGYWGVGGQDPSFNHNPNMYFRKVLISDGSVVSSWDSTLNIWGTTAIDGDWIWQGVGAQTPFPQWDMWKINHTTWSGIQRFTFGYHTYTVFA